MVESQFCPEKEMFAGGGGGGGVFSRFSRRQIKKATSKTDRIKPP